MTKRTIQIIANPGRQAGRLNLKDRAANLAGMRPAGTSPSFKRADDAKRLARKAAKSGADIVAIFGGDGSVAEAAAGLAGTKTALRILPGGTANVMSVELGIPARSGRCA